MGIYCSADHIGGSDINVCRTLGDYDLGLPLKGRDPQGRQLGPLISGGLLSSAGWAGGRVGGRAGGCEAGWLAGCWIGRLGPVCGTAETPGLR